MGEQKRKVALPAMISVLIPERGRPEMLDRLVQSLVDTAGQDSNYEILVAIDSDDPAWPDNRWLEWEASLGLLGHVETFRWPRPLTLGEKLNALAREAKGDIFWFLANDHIVETPEWPAIIRAAAKKLPNSVGVLYPHDDSHPGHASFPILTRHTTSAVGFFMPPCYPYWFIDTHWDHLGIMLGERHEVPITVRAPDGRGKSHSLVDLEFWVRFFYAMEPVRVREAAQLMAAAYGDGSTIFKAAMQDLGRRQQTCRQRVAHLSTPAFLAQWGGTSDSPPSPDYPKVKAYAENMMLKLGAGQPRRPKVAICIPSGRTWEAKTATAIASLAAFSAMSGIDCAFLNVQSSAITHGRNSTVDIALAENVDALLWIDSDNTFSPDALVRLLQHDVDVVGATYNRRTPNAQGVYTVLGRLAGTKPEQMNDGLYEALLLPSGMMLVRAEVYRKIGKPYYAEAYDFPAADGLASLKALLSNYFSDEPPTEVLASLDGTALADWIKDRWIVGEEGERSPYFSEDLWFCRKVRRAGYKVWCDVRLSGVMGHLGTLEVTTDLPAEIERLPNPIRKTSSGDATVAGEPFLVRAPEKPIDGVPSSAL